MDLDRQLSGLAGFTIIWSFLILLIFGLLNWLQIPSGQFVDWLIGSVSFWWLMVVVTLPWNVHFQARAVRADAQLSQAQGITVSDHDLNYLKTVQNWSLRLALGLHWVSAIAFYGLAATGLGTIGYLSAGAALLLTGLRPAIAVYQYLAQRLATLRQDLKYPREDVVELRSRVEQLAARQATLSQQLDLDESSSWAAKQARTIQTLQADLATINAALEQTKAMNAQEHERILQASRDAIAQLNEDSRFLGQVREIVRFLKTA
ncbi:MAG: hypothetical protein AAGG51_06440 [Cyanobacteria bacterium P01_G01_bin.54]